MSSQMLMPSRRAARCRAPARRETARSSGPRRRRRRSAAAPCGSAADRARCEQRGAVEERPSFVRRIRLRQADQRRREPSAASRASAVELRPSCARDEVGARAADRAADSRPAPARASRPDRRRRARGRARAHRDQPRVAREVADGRIDLQEGDLHDSRVGQLLDEAVFEQHPERHEAGRPRDLLAFIVAAAGVGDRHFVDAVAALEDLRGDLRLDAEAVRPRA